MKVLFFDAAAAHPDGAPRLQSQAWQALRPFNQYLRQAIRTAKQRQVRYKLGWERVRHQRLLELRPLTTWLLVPRRPPAWLITDWPEAGRPEPSQPMMVVNRGATARVESCSPHPRGLRVEIDPSDMLLATDRVFWCSRECTLEPEAESPPPADVRDPAGRRLEVLRAEPREHDRWALLVQGDVTAETVHLDGEAVPAEPLPWREGLRRLDDEAHRTFELSDGGLRVEELPAGQILRGDNGLQFAWKEAAPDGRRGAWVQLLMPESIDAEEVLDPRAAFCEDDVKEVWTQPRHSKETVFKVKRIDRERYQLELHAYPPAGTQLHLPVDVRSLQLQQRALRQLAEAPLPSHQGLLRLAEDPADVRWPAVTSAPPPAWQELVDRTRDGTHEQQRFVEKALGTPDLALLEGPPGSGKTTAICELIRQLAARGQRVLLCASTHAAIDNVIEKLLDADAPVDVVRIGRPERVDPKVEACQLDVRIDHLLAAWRDVPALRAPGEDDLREMAERTVVAGADLTCGTTMGIIHHPAFRDRDPELPLWERPITTWPHWDVLIVDEASKTLIQEFLVPALMARRSVIVGDVHQLPPFTDRRDLVANLRTLVDARDEEVFPADHQRARLLLFRLADPRLRRARARWLLVETAGVLDWIDAELEGLTGFDLELVRIVPRPTGRTHHVREVLLRDVLAGAPSALQLAVADWVLVAEDLLPQVPQVADRLPTHLLLVRDLTDRARGRLLDEAAPFLFRQAHGLDRAGALMSPLKERGRELTTFAELQRHESEWLARHDWAGEMAWRLTRIHELKHSRNARERDRLQNDIKQLLPRAADIEEFIGEIEDIGLPSILEVLQEGIGTERSGRPSALTEGLPRRHRKAFAERFESLPYQHRMHPSIAAFARETFYEGKALRDANTIARRDETLGWGFSEQILADLAPERRQRRMWIDVRGEDRCGVNSREVDVMEAMLRAFIAWVKQHGPPARKRPAAWEVACLCFYLKQESAIRAMLQRLTGEGERQNRFPLGSIEIVCGTVDRFQGREADLVLLSMRNTRRIGFLDSPNRLNVAVTRARQQLFVLGRREFYKTCRTRELEALAERSGVMDSGALLKTWGRKA